MVTAEVPSPFAGGSWRSCGHPSGEFRVGGSLLIDLG